MSFLESLEAGFGEGSEAARLSKIANEEIDDVINTVINFLKSKLREEVVVRHTQDTESENLGLPKKRKSVDPLGLGAFGALVAHTQPRWVDLVEAIEVHAGRAVRLCEFERSTRGFPVEVRYVDLAVSAYDRGSLEKVFVNVFKEPGVTSKIVQYVREGASKIA